MFRDAFTSFKHLVKPIHQRIKMCSICYWDRSMVVQWQLFVKYWAAVEICEIVFSSESWKNWNGNKYNPQIHLMLVYVNDQSWPLHTFFIQFCTINGQNSQHFQYDASPRMYIHHGPYEQMIRWIAHRGSGHCTPIMGSVNDCPVKTYI